MSMIDAFRSLGRADALKQDNLLYDAATHPEAWEDVTDNG
jgi:hypothetical protein